MKLTESCVDIKRSGLLSLAACSSLLLCVGAYQTCDKSDQLTDLAEKKTRKKKNSGVAENRLVWLQELVAQART